jgi:glutamate formiminotransferase/formiminotetrahydrofolate cyclodeaminase
MTALGMPKSSDSEKTARQQALQAATLRAMEVPKSVMHHALDAFPLIRKMVEHGNPNSITDAGVGALCARAAVVGAALNVKVNALGLDDQPLVQQFVADADACILRAEMEEQEIIQMVKEKMGV